MRILLSGLGLVISLSVFSQKFSPFYKIRTSTRAWNIHAVVAGNGNMLIYGEFAYINGSYHGRLLCVNSAGEIVPAFQPVYADGYIDHVVVQPDKKILISGDFTEINGNPVNQPVRLNEDGSVDNTFSSTLTGRVYDMAVQHTGKVIISHEGTLKRLNSNGTSDGTFVQKFTGISNLPIAIGTNDEVFSIAFQYSPYTYQAIKLSSDGTEDAAYSSGEGTKGDQIFALALQPDGKVLIGCSSYNGSASKGIVRLMPDGSVDQTFNAGQNISGTILSIVLRNDKILIAGYFNTYNNLPASLIQLNSDGGLSRVLATVSTGMSNATDGFIYSIMADGSKITALGTFEKVNSIAMPNLFRIDADAPDNTFDPALKGISLASSRNYLYLSVDSKRRAVLGSATSLDIKGIFSDNKLIPGHVMRVNALGVPDATLNIPLLSDQTTLFCQTFQKDDKLVVSGRLPGQTQRFNTDATIDGIFAVGMFTNSFDYQIPPTVVTQIGSLLYFGGSFSKYNQTATNCVAAVDLNGNLVKTFTGLPETSSVYQIEAQGDKILLRGYFELRNGNFGIIRFNQDGSLDNTFNMLATNTIPQSMAVDENHRIYVSGYGNVIGGVWSPLVRLLPDGTLDPTFDMTGKFEPGTGVFAIRSVGAGKIAIGGSFQSFAGASAPAIAFLNADGTAINWQNTLGKGSEVYRMEYRDGMLYMTGNFFNADHTDAFGLTKVLVNNVFYPIEPQTLTATVEGDGELKLTWSDASNDELAFVVERSSGTDVNFTAIDTLEANTTSFTEHIERNIAYRYRVNSFNEAGFSPHSETASVTWTPAPLGELVLDAINNGLNAKLTWSPNVKYHDGFKVYRASTASGPFDLLETAPAIMNSYTDDLAPGETQVYRIVAFNEFGTIESNVVSVVITGLSSNEQSLRVFPNPSTDMIMLSGIEGVELESLQLQAVDGRAQKMILEKISADEARVDVTQLSKGLYVLSYNREGKRFQAKVVKK